MQQNNALELLAVTTGAGIAIGGTGNIDIGGIYICSAATTVTIIANGTTAIQLAASVDFDPPYALTGPITATSSGGNFFLGFRRR